MTNTDPRRRRRRHRRRRPCWIVLRVTNLRRAGHRGIWRFCLGPGRINGRAIGRHFAAVAEGDR